MYIYMYITPYVKPEHITPARNINNLSPAQTQPDTNTHHTPQPSTPIKHAGSDSCRI